jgi:hypothetical protein
VARSSVSALIQASVATGLTCTLDDTSVSCGAASPTCAVAVCEQFTAGGLSPGDHQLSVQSSDGSYGFYDFDVDMTPPDTTDLELNQDIDVNPLRPQFTFWITNGDDQDLGSTNVPPYTLDSAQCSMTRVGGAPSWSTCPYYVPWGDFEGFEYRPSLPATHVDYVFQARGVDPLGRVDPTPSSVLYDPVPCGVSLRAPKTRHALLHSGVAVTLQCTGQFPATVYILLVKKNGHPVHVALPVAGPESFATASGVHTYRRRLKIRVPLLLTGARSYTLTVKAITPLISGSRSFTITAGPGHGTGSGRSRSRGHR